MTFTTYGLSSHIKQRKYLADQQTMKLKRFKGLDCKMRTRLFTTMIRPILEYPVVPVCVASTANISKLQKSQNKALRSCWPGNTIEERVTNIQLHNRFSLETINVRLHSLACRVWTKMEILHNDLTTQSNDLNNINGDDHRWWPRLSPYIVRGESAPLYY